MLRAATSLTAVEGGDATSLALEWLRQRDQARGSVAELLGATMDDISLVESTTHGLGIVAGGLPLRPGTNVVVGDCDFIGLPTVWRAQERAGVELRAARSVRGRLSLDAVREAVDSRTRVLSFSAVQEVSGCPVDLDGVAEIAASVGAYVVVDAVQEAGVIHRHPARHGIDAYASGGHKWLGNPYGLGFLWTSERLREQLHPPFQGYFALSVPDGGWPAHLHDSTKTSLEPLLMRGDGPALELGGTPNWLGAVGLGTAVDQLVRKGPALAESRALELADLLRDGLESRAVSAFTEVGTRSPIVTFTLAPRCHDKHFVDLAEREGIRLSARGSAGVHGIRAGCHAHNTVEDVRAVLDLVDRCLAGRSTAAATPSEKP